MCGFKKYIQSYYTYAWSMKGQEHLHIIGTRTLLVQKTLKGWKPLIIRTDRVSRIGRTSPKEYKRDHTQSPNADWASFFEFLFARLVDWVLAGASLVGELLIPLTKLKFSRLYRNISNLCGDC